MTGIEAVGVAFIGALVAIFFFIVNLSLPKEKDWITEAEEETRRIKQEIEMLKTYEVFYKEKNGKEDNTRMGKD